MLAPRVFDRWYPMFPSLSFRVPALAGVFLMLAGCGTLDPCRSGNSDYLSARERPRIQMPEGVTGSERLSGTVLVIPAASPTPDKLDPAPRCLDEPPPFFRKASAGGTAAVAGSPEEAANVWALAWAGRKADQVAAFYSRNFQTTETGGAAAYIAQRREQVTNGKAADPRLDEVKVTSQASDRSVVTFVQRFGGSAVRKELTLVREAQGWRIVSERTIEVL